MHHEPQQPTGLKGPAAQPHHDKPAPPVHEIKNGAVKCAIWKREGKNGHWHEATFIRLWKDDGKDQWRESNSFGERHLADLAQVVTDAREWMGASQLEPQVEG